MAKRSTLQVVAEAVGLSVNTVSRALNGKSGVSESTRSRIKAEAARLGYVPNANARSLVLGKRSTIGVVVTDLANPYFNDLVSEIEEQALQAGYTILLLLSDEDPDRERAAIEAALHAGVDGIIGVPVQGKSNPWTAVLQAGVPLVLTARRVTELDVDFFSNDNEAGGYMTTSAVLERGARDPLLIEEDMRISTVEHRIAGFRRALEDHGIPFDTSRRVFVPSRRNVRGAMHWRAEDGYRVARDILSSGRRPDAFLVGNDYFALGLYSALQERNIRVPEDTLVMGWGDYAFSRFLNPPLSTLKLPSAEVARRATARLFARLNGEGTEDTVTVMIKPEIALRSSTNR
ncbi:LacI family transcriptional regulator [Arthrobacter psychrolactophilus]|uniref:LacI family transcriptional regulator n=1 Tax=Arthrobacter psychrolactophilus TaxID=92442 RepID=A0A2V5ISE8_9MICC|nr:LacI family DNA-binding transcriptional regulator [Arthrobacter psychrolactophilus]PYI37053.1 LacI family transcriptional regulator [Arthrobacter psychrolactophilus]